MTGMLILSSIQYPPQWGKATQNSTLSPAGKSKGVMFNTSPLSWVTHLMQWPQVQLINFILHAQALGSFEISKWLCVSMQIRWISCVLVCVCVSVCVFWNLEPKASSSLPTLVLSFWYNTLKSDSALLHTTYLPRTQNTFNTYFLKRLNEWMNEEWMNDSSASLGPLAWIQGKDKE